LQQFFRKVRLVKISIFVYFFEKLIFLLNLTVSITLRFE
jgi:hypothetical protein